MEQEIVTRTFRFRLSPCAGEEEKMRRLAGASRWVWNQGVAYLDARRELYTAAKEKGEEPPPFPGFMTPEVGLAAFFTELRHKEENAWLRESSFAAARYPLKRLDITYRRAIKNPADGFPKFHAKGRAPDSFTIPEKIKLGARGIHIPRIGWVRMKKNRGRGGCDVEGTPKMAVIKYDGGRWMAAVQCEIVRDKPARSKGAGMVGLDAGVAKHIAAVDDSGAENIFNHPKNQRAHLARLEARRRRYQRMMSRRRDAALRAAGWDGKPKTRKAAEAKVTKRWQKKKAAWQAAGEKTPMPQRNSNRYELARRRMAKTSRLIAQRRFDWQHKTSAMLARQYAAAVVEDLKVAQMTRSAKGDEKQPGKNVRAKAGLNRAILAVGWSGLYDKLDYKMADGGGVLIRVKPKNTSRRCFECGHTAEENRKSQAQFLCAKCGYKENADINAAKNILALGREQFFASGAGAVSNAGANGRGGRGIGQPVKRQSTERSRQVNRASLRTSSAHKPKNQGQAKEQVGLP